MGNIIILQPLPPKKQRCKWVTDEGELFSLEQLDIISLDVNSNTLDDHVTPQGTTLRESATFTRGDGSVGNNYGAVFETDATDTIFRGDKGIALPDELIRPRQTDQCIDEMVPYLGNYSAPRIRAYYALISRYCSQKGLKRGFPD